MTFKYNESFRFKLIFWTVTVCILVFVLIYSSCLYFSAKQVRMEMEATVNAKLDCISEFLDGGATATKVSSDNLMSLLGSSLVPLVDTNIESLIEFFLDHNTFTNGVAIGFEPGVIEGHPKGYAPYLMRTSKGYISKDLSKIRNYRAADWYERAYSADRQAWSKPFFESNGLLITSLNTPIHDRDGKVIGVAAVDIKLSRLSEDLKSMLPFPGSSIEILDADGLYVASTADEKLIGKEFNLPMKEEILSGERYYASYKPNGAKDEQFIFYTPTQGTGWRVILTIPKSVITSDIMKMLRVLFVIMVLGIVFLILVCRYIISKLSEPLEQFSNAAKQISRGNFDIELPTIKDHNELFDLRQALASMKMSLNEYIEKLSETSAREARIENELSIARTIQMSMVPKVFPAFPERHDVEIYASLIPAQAVGGDLYDYILCGDKLFFCIGDVSGKGVPASLFMAITRSLFRNTAAEDKTPSMIAKIINNGVCEGNDEMLFVTMYIGCCDLKTGDFSICNCGHNAPVTNSILIDASKPLFGPDKTARFISDPPTNIPIGVIEGYDYKEVNMRILPGTKLLLYTDGITEAENSSKELFGDDRLIKSIMRCRTEANAEEVINQLVNDVHKFTDGAPQSDDITCLAMFYK